MISKSNLKYYLALIFAVVIWSSSIIVTKVTIAGFGPVALSFSRALVAYLFLLPFSINQGFHFKMLFSRQAAIYGILGYGGNLILLTFGLQYCSAGISSIIQGLSPFFMIFFGYFLLSEEVTKNKIQGILLSVAGVIIATIGDFASNEGTIWGIILVVLSVFTWAFYSVYAKKTGAGLNSLVLTQLCLGISVLFIAPLFLLEVGLSGIELPSIAALGSILYLGIMSGGVALILWNYGLKYVNSAISGIYLNLIPVFGLIFAFFIGESINHIQIAGCLLVFAGVLIGTGFKKGKKDIAKL